MEISGRLVGEDDSRICHHGAGNADELLLTAGKLAGKKILLADDLKTIKRVANYRLPIFLAHVAIRKRQLEILKNSLVVEQVITLKHKADVAIAQVAARFLWSSLWTATSSK